MDILVYDPAHSKNTAYFRREQSGRLVPVGFQDLMGKLVRVSELEGAVVLAHDEEEIPPEECVIFDAETMANRNVIRFLESRKAIGCLFVQVFGIWVQSGAYILQSHIKEVQPRDGRRKT